MSQHNGSTSDEWLDSAAHALQQSQVLELPPGLVASTVDAISNRSNLAAPRRTMRRLALRLGAIAATLLLAIGGIVALAPQGGAGVALAQVLDKVKEAESVEFVLRPGQRLTSEKDHKCVFYGEKLRVLHPNGIVMIADVKSKAGLFLDAKNKIAGRFILHKHVATELAIDPIVQLQQARSDAAEFLGKEVLDGKHVNVFRVRGVKLFGVESDRGEMRVWVDSTSMLPQRIEMRMGKSAIVTLKDMHWNLAIDPALLSMEIPAGYAEETEVAFRKRLSPSADAEKPITATEAFRKWQGDGK